MQQYEKNQHIFRHIPHNLRHGYLIALRIRIILLRGRTMATIPSDLRRPLLFAVSKRRCSWRHFSSNRIFRLRCHTSKMANRRQLMHWRQYVWLHEDALREDRLCLPFAKGAGWSQRSEIQLRA